MTEARNALMEDAIALPAHPGRFGIGLTDYIAEGESFDDVTIVERFNGGSRPGENERADELCESHNLLGIGGSDAHLTSHIATCMTDFKAPIKTESDLVDALLSKEFQPVWLENVVNGASQ